MTERTDSNETVTARPMRSPVHSTNSWHRIEEIVQVPLTIGPEGSWEIDGGDIENHASDCQGDTAPLEGYPDGPNGKECECMDQDRHDASLNQARETPLPSAVDLVYLLAAHYGLRIQGDERP
jgi:hypothetical protein